MEKEEKKDNTEKTIFKEIIEWILYVGVILILSYLIVTYIGQRTKVSGRSMENTLHDGDNLIVNKIGYRFNEPKRFDIVVFPYQYKEKTWYIKRIIGLPGETVQIIDGYVYINDKKLDEHYGKEVMEFPGIAEEKIKLSKDEYFVLGDNRNHSADSRMPEVGLIKRDKLLGKATIRIWPFDDFGGLKDEKND